MTLFEEPNEFVDHRPVLMELQADLLQRGRAAYRDRIRRVIWQAHCGAGKTIIAGEQTRRALELGKTVLHIVHRRRLVDQMLSTLLKFGIYASPIMQGRQTWNSQVYCASRDTLLAMLKDGIDLPRVDVVIWDECHVAAFALQQWYLTHCPDAYWTGYTATPVCSNGRSLNPPYQALVCMGSPQRLIQAGRLCQVKVYNPDAIGQRRAKGDKVKPVGDPVDHWLKYANGLPTVCFAQSVKDSQSLVQRYVERNITAEHIDAFTSDDEREAVFDRSESGQTKIISNCGVLIEGVDLPWLTCCQILRGCNSLVLWIQATGRVMRAFPGKDYGIVLDHAGAAHEFGLPDCDFQWELADEATNAKKNKPRKDNKPVTCPQCAFVFVRKPACPQCGHVLPIKRRKSLLDSVRPGDGILTEYNGRGREIQQETYDRLFRKCYYIAKAKGWLMRNCIGMFKRETGIPPWEADLHCNVPKFDEWQTPAKEWQI